MIDSQTYRASDYPKIDPDLRQKGWQLHHEVYFNDMAGLRTVSQASDQVPLPEDETIDCQEIWIEGPSGQPLALILYRLKERAQYPVPGLLWLHGGGYAMGNPRMDLWFVKPLIEATGAIVVAPDYRRSTQAPYPAALEDAYASLRWLAEQAVELGINPRQLMIGGRSAGAGLSVATCLYSRDQGGPSLAFQMPIYPMLDNQCATASMRGNESFCWNEQRNRLAWELYLGPDYASPTVPIYAAPYGAEDLHGLPPAYSFVGDQDPFYDETLTYIQRLQEAGIPAHVDCFPGAYHGFDALDTPISHRARQACLVAFEAAVATYFIDKEVGRP